MIGYALEQSPIMMANSTGSLPRNLAATLQDIEMKRQLALQQKGMHTVLKLSPHIKVALTSLLLLLYIKKTHCRRKYLTFFPV